MLIDLNYLLKLYFSMEIQIYSLKKDEIFAPSFLVLEVINNFTLF